MESLVLELQRESYDSSKSISDLLRKALIVARKLKIKDLEIWLDSELNGYKKIESVPDYRSVSGEVKGFNPYRGWVPVMIDNDEWAQALSNRTLTEPITHLEALVKQSNGRLVLKYSQGLEMALAQGLPFETNIQLFIDKTQVESIIESVRNVVLTWSLKLEEDGIMGEGMTFSEKEKKVAEQSKYNINNFFGNIEGSQIQQDVHHSSQSMESSPLNMDGLQKLIELLKHHIDDVDLDKDSKNELTSDIETIETQLKSPKPKPKIIRESLSSIRSILEGITGSVIASGLIYQITQFFAS